MTEVDIDHLVEDHGIARKAINSVKPGARRDQQRNVSLYYEMMHAADHAQRDVGHEH